jgi:hypothetical protein
MDSTFALDETDHLCNGVFWWDRYQYVNMIRPKVPFQYLALFLPGKTVKQVGKVFPDSAKQYLATTFWNPYNVVLAIPFRVT